eukprot:RCo052211
MATVSARKGSNAESGFSAALFALPERKLNPATVMKSLPPPACLRMKIISMGDAGVGKSCLIKRYCEERFVSRYVTTIGVDYGVKKVTVDGKEIKVNFWDLSGNPDYLEVRNEFYKDAQGAILVYDVAQRKSFESLSKWLDEAQQHGVTEGLTIYLCANKTDAGGRRAVSELDGQRLATSRGWNYCETSASSGAGVTEMFEKLFRDVLRSKVRPSG